MTRRPATLAEIRAVVRDEVQALLVELGLRPANEQAMSDEDRELVERAKIVAAKVKRARNVK